jgi:hypothetical protein
MEGIGERIREHGWRQGVIVPASSLFESLPDGSPVPDDDYAMIVSQSCDLLHHKLENEPFAQILIAKSIAAGNPEALHGRNPRRLHFQSIDGRWFEAWAWNQSVIPRDQLCERAVLSEIELAPEVLRRVLDWLAKRYTRIAFPDAFNVALKAKSDSIGKLLKKNHDLFTEILLYVSPFDELEADEIYELACYLLMSEEVHGDPGRLARAQDVAAALEKLLADAGFDVAECSPVSEAEITVAELNELVRWDYDHLTHSAADAT